MSLSLLQSMLHPSRPPARRIGSLIAACATVAAGVSSVHAQTAVLEVTNAGDETVFQVFDKGVLVGLDASTTEILPVEGPGARLLWYPFKEALRAGEVSGDQWNAVNIGNFSVAFGRNTVASGQASTALGEGATASGLGSMAVGLPWAGIDPQFNPGATASGDGSFAVGHGTLASGNGSVAIGVTTVNTNGATASGEGAFALGPFDATAVGEESFAIGHDVFAGADNSMAIGVDAAVASAHSGAIVIGTPLGRISSQGPNQFVVHAAHLWFGANEAAIVYNTTHLIDTETGAYLSDGGVWTNNSDAARKEHYRAVDGAALLAKVGEIPVRTWNYKKESDEVRHMGPTAQDFYAAFGLGDSERAIATVDIAGVNLRAVQALEARTRRLREQNEALEARIAQLEAILRQDGRRRAGL